MGVATGISKFRLILAAAGAVAIGACDVVGSNNSRDDDEASKSDAPAMSGSGMQAEPSTDVAAKGSATLEVVRAANSYDLEWSAEPRVCEAALIALNKPYTVSTEVGAGLDGLDYASAQAARFLVTEHNIQWRDDDVAVATPVETEVAVFDYFNDGVERVVVRMRDSLAGSKLISLGILESNDAELVRLNFGHAGVVSEDLPDTENLHSKLTYSVADVINLDSGYYTLLMPLEDFDSSGRVYLAAWEAKAGTTPPRRASDYYSALACVFRLKGAATVKSE